MNSKIERVTAPYLYEGAVGGLEDFVIGLVMFFAFAIGGFKTQADVKTGVIISISVAIVFMVTMDVPLMIKCLMDRNQKHIITISGTLEDVLPDKNWSYKFKPSSGVTSESCVYYYPKSWMMWRYKLAIRTIDGRMVKPRSIHSISHGQHKISNIISMQEKYVRPLILKVRYLEHTRAIVDVSVESYPDDMKKQTLEYIEGMLSDITRWTVKRR